MGRNREPVKPVESESESGEEGSSEEVDSQESEPEAEQTQKKSQPLLPSEEEGSGSETESDSNASKPREEAQKSSRKARSKPNAAKRPAEDTATKDAKKSKKATDPETSEKKPNLFQRVWSEEDEIVVLRGMVDYWSKKKSDPISDLNAFHDFIKKSLHIDVSRSQLQDKIRRLKRKYENNKSKEKEGKERAFSKFHEQNSYDLSKEIWGNETGKENANIGSVARNKKAKNAVESEEAKNAVETQRVNANSSMEERMLVNGREIYEAGQGVEGEKEWEKLREEELQLYLKYLELRVAQTNLVLNVITQSP